MKLQGVRVHNFRSFKDDEFRLGDYALLVGPNNCGKSNLLDAIRIVYEKDIKFDHDRDFPKFLTDDAESWVELEFVLKAGESANLKADYLIGSDKFRIRKWLHPAEKAKSGFFGYENGALSENLFYGWKNVSQSKLGSLVYIPAVSKLEEHTKLTGPSPLRDLVQNILQPIIGSSDAFAKLKEQFDQFSQVIKKQETEDKRSLAGLEEKINLELKSWNAKFQLEVVNPEEDQILKNMVRHSITDGKLQQSMSADSFGHGFQRHLIFTLISVAASYVSPKKVSPKKEFSPELNLILFEEPEAYLHPPQQDVLDTSLRRLSRLPEQQVIVSTHSAHFVSSNTEDLANLVLLRNLNGQTDKGQISTDELKDIFEDNEKIRVALGRKKSGDDEPTSMALEASKYMFWLNPERSGLFFARYVLIVEGLSERALINRAIKEGVIEVPSGGLFILEVMGKYNIHRFMNLFGKMKIEHYVLHDTDGPDHAALNTLIKNSINQFTLGHSVLPETLEKFLGIEIPQTDEGRRWKAGYVFLAAKNGTVNHEKLDSFHGLIAELIKKSNAVI